MVMAVLITMATVGVFTNGINDGSLNGIRQDWSWKKHSLVDRLRTETMAGISGLDEAKSNQIAQELEFNRAGRHKIAWELDSAEQEQIKLLGS